MCNCNNCRNECVNNNRDKDSRCKSRDRCRDGDRCRDRCKCKNNCSCQIQCRPPNCRDCHYCSKHDPNKHENNNRNMNCYNKDGCDQQNFVITIAQSK